MWPSGVCETSVKLLIIMLFDYTESNTVRIWSPFGLINLISLWWHNSYKSEADSIIPFPSKSLRDTHTHTFLLNTVGIKMFINPANNSPVLVKSWCYQIRHHFHASILFIRYIRKKHLSSVWNTTTFTESVLCGLINLKKWSFFIL